MPRQVQERLTRRQQVDPRTTFDYTTPDIKVFAQPTDPYVDPANAGDKWRRLAASLGIAQEGLQLVGQGLQYYQDKETRAGQLAALKGEEKPSQGMYRIQGWESMNGQLTAKKEYRQELEQFFQENYKTMAPEDFEAGANAISQKYIQGATNYWLEGFLPAASEIEQKYFNAYNEAQRELVYQQTLDLLNTDSETEVTLAVEDALKEFFDINNLDELTTRPDVYAVISKSDFGKRLAPTLRKSLTNLQKAAKKLGLSKAEVSSIFLEQVGNIAKRYGLPELLDFAYERDESGIALARSNAGRATDQYRASAEARQSSVIDAYNKGITAQQEEEAKNRQREFINSTNLQRINLESQSRTNPVEAAAKARELLDQLVLNPEFLRLPESTFKEIVSSLMEIESKDTWFADKSEGKVFEELFSKDELTLEDIKANRASLSREDWLKLMAKYKTQQEARVKQEAEEAQNRFNKETNTRVETVIATGNPSEALALLAELQTNPLFMNMSDDDHASITRRLLEKGAEGTTFAKVSDDEAYRVLVLRRANGSLTLDLIETYKNKLTRKDWEGFVNDFVAQEQAKAKALADEKDRLNKEIQEQQARIFEEETKVFTQDMDTKLSDLDMLTNPVEIVSMAKQLRQQFLEDSRSRQLSPSEYRRILDAITDKIIQNTSFPLRGDAALYLDLYEKAKKLELTEEEIENAVANGWLSADQYKSLLDEKAKQDALLAQERKDFQARVEKLAKEAEQERERRIQEEQRLAEKEAERARNDSIKEMWSGIFEIYEITDPREQSRRAKDLIEKLDEENYLHDYDATTYRQLRSELSNLVQGGRSFPTQGDDWLYVDLMSKALFGDLDWAEVQAAADNADLTESQFNSLRTAFQQQQEAIEASKAEWPDKSMIMSTWELVKQAVVGSNLMAGIIPEEKLTQLSTIQHNFNQALLKFRANNDGRDPDYDEFLEMVEPILTRHGVTWDKVFNNTGEVSETQIQINKDTKKPVSQVNPEELAMTQGPKILGFPGKPQYNPEWSLSKETAFEKYQQSFNLGVSKQDIETYLLQTKDKDGNAIFTEESVKFYSQNYANTYAYNYFTEQGEVTDEGIREVTNKLLDLGYSQLEIVQAIGVANEQLKGETSK